MGQAVDLPDPLEAPATPAANSSADDLLSQLAGEEIDRLLAESDAEFATQAAAPAPTTEASTANLTATKLAAAELPAVDLPAAPPADEGLESQLDKVLAEAANGAPRSAIETSSAIAAPESSTLTALATPAAEAPVSAKELDASLAAQAAATQPTAPSSDANQSAAAKTEVQSAVNEIETSLQERGGLSDSTAGEISIDSGEDEPVPMYLKPLVWLNAPLMILPEPIRDAIGKIAILTMFNAAAVFAYVLIFRRHHH